MKSPWKFLVGLTKRTVKDASGFPASSEEPKPLHSQDLVALSSDVDAAPISSVGEAGIPPRFPADEPEHVDDLATLAAIAAASAKVKEESPATKSQRTRVRNVSGELLTHEKSITLRPSNQLDDARALDDEISQLRVKLQQKLELQNAQLKQMLKRFER